MSKKKSFDYEEFKKTFASRFKDNKSLRGKDDALTPLIEEFLEEALAGELEAHIEESEEPNRKNGKLSKTLKTSFGKVDLNTPRDRNGTFELEIVGKRQRNHGG